ncbi:MAG: transposase [Clostridiales bacterium]|nr:transposase [Clostridiales bacterium]
MTAEEILNIYTNRWQIEVFFRQTKDKLAIDKYQIRKSLGIRRYLLLMSLTHFLCCNYADKLCSFEEGYDYFAKTTQKGIYPPVYL